MQKETNVKKSEEIREKEREAKKEPEGEEWAGFVTNRGKREGKM